MHRSPSPTLAALGLVGVLAGCQSHSLDSELELAPEPTNPPQKTLESVVEQTLARSDYRPSSKALAWQPPAVESPSERYRTRRAPLVSQVGEIVVLEGGDTTVTDFGDGDYGLALTSLTQNPIAITNEFFQSYPDEFDVITVFTTFPDQGSQDSVAWYLPIRLSVGGVGAEQLDNGNFWGSDAALHGFINMQYVGQYGTELTDPDSYVHSVMAQEFGHRWGSFARYVDGNGQASTAMLGRDGSHWASTLQANGSVMDGNQFEQVDSNTFRVVASNYRFSELDQYIMGLLGPDDVPDWFLIQNATRNGQPVNPAYPLPVGAVINGTRENITIEQVIKAHGPRNPSHVDAQKDFRLAVVLVTRPGETADQVQAFVDRLEDFRLTFEQAAAQMSDNRLRVCTQVSAPCNSPRLTLADVVVTEEQGNGDGSIDPGEVIRLTVSATSSGFGDATEASVSVGEVGEELRVVQYTVPLADVPEGETVTATEPLLVRIPYDTPCGSEIRIPLTLTTQGRNFPAETHIEVGLNALLIDGFDDPGAWTINPYGTDTAEGGVWEVDAPKGVDALYTGVNLVTQPSQDHSLSGVNALVTGAEGGDIGANDVDGGMTTALSPEYDISGATNPILSWYMWRFAYDFNNIEGVVPVEDDPLYVEASVDGGLTWTLLEANTSNAQGWVRKDVRLRNQLELTGRLQLRFTMGDLGKANVNEALIDDILIWEESPGCGVDGPVTPDEDPVNAETDNPESMDGAELPDNPEASEDDPTAPVQGEESSGCQASNAPGSSGGAVVFAFMLLMAAVIRRGRGQL